MKAMLRFAVLAAACAAILWYLAKPTPEQEARRERPAATGDETSEASMESDGQYDETWEERALMRERIRDRMR